MRKGLIVLAMLLLCGCGAREPQTGTKTESESGTAVEETVSMYDLRVAMEGADDTLPPMLNASSAGKDAKSNFSHISDMDYEKVDSYFVSYAEEGGKADEIVVIAVKNIGDVEEAEKSLKEHRTDRYKLLEQYEPAETKRIEDGIVFSNGRYAVLIICDNSGAVKKAFENATGVK